MDEHWYAERLADLAEDRAFGETRSMEEAGWNLACRVIAGRIRAEGRAIILSAINEALRHRAPASEPASGDAP